MKTKIKQIGFWLMLIVIVIIYFYPQQHNKTESNPFFQSDTNGYRITFPDSWKGKYKVNHITKTMDFGQQVSTYPVMDRIEYVPKNKSLQPALLMTIEVFPYYLWKNNGTNPMSEKNLIKVVGDKVFAYTLPSENPYISNSTSTEAQDMQNMEKQIPDIIRTLTEIKYKK